jgi:hypothetical protein
MARQYSAKNFIRKVPNRLLQQYFHDQRIDLDIDWARLGETDADAVFDAIQALPDHQRGEVESDFTMINELACSAGVAAILEEAAFWGKDWSDDFEKMENDYERAIWTFLNEPRRFEVAGAFHEMDRFSGWWRRFVGKRLEPATDSDAREKFGARLRMYYRRQGRGRYCHVDIYQRHDPERFCYFAYPEDIATTDLGYEDGGKFSRRPRRSAFELIFVYRPEDGCIEMHAQGVKKVKEELAAIFCTTILGLKALPDDSGKEPYNLSCLKDASFPFKTEPNDQVLDVEPKLLRLDLPYDKSKGTGRRIVLTASSLPDAPNALHRLMEEAINHRCVPMDDVVISQAKLKFTFRSPNGRQPKTLTFEITYPDRCTLKDDRYDQVAKKYLKRWGIARD